jgi:hypothetical protein
LPEEAGEFLLRRRAGSRAPRRAEPSLTRARRVEEGCWSRCHAAAERRKGDHQGP